MCIAIPSPGHRDRAGGLRWWHHLSASPLRLLGFSSGLQLAGLAIFSAISVPGDPLTVSLPPLFVALGTLLLGTYVTSMPLRLKALPFSYPFLVGIFALITAGGLLALLPSWAAAGQALVLSGWLISLRALWWKLKWAPRRLARTLWTQFGVLIAMVAALAAMLPAWLLGPLPIATIAAGAGLAATLVGGVLLAIEPVFGLKVDFLSTSSTPFRHTSHANPFSSSPRR